MPRSVEDAGNDWDVQLLGNWRNDDFCQGHKADEIEIRLNVCVHFGDSKGLKFRQTESLALDLKRTESPPMERPPLGAYLTCVLLWFLFHYFLKKDHKSQAPTANTAMVPTFRTDCSFSDMAYPFDVVPVRILRSIHW